MKPGDPGYKGPAPLGISDYTMHDLTVDFSMDEDPRFSGAMGANTSDDVERLFEECVAMHYGCLDSPLSRELEGIDQRIDGEWHPESGCWRRVGC